ncbi:MAG: hypothetical protein SVU94_05000 [Bacteroidota bacterium]|nr:hypothetical protein [Bacteroidota bacterium]
MKKQILFIALVGFLTMSFNTLIAQEPGRKPRKEQVATLTAKQIKKVNKILADYDSKSITKEDAKTIMDALREAKIPGGKGVEKAFTDAGFDFEEIRKLAPRPSRPER